jgi:KDO2-lipid IV(A) lauroyltransferase
VGLVVCAFAPSRRRAIAKTLRIVRGERGPLRDAVDVATTFVTYAACLTEVLSSGSRNAEQARIDITGGYRFDEALGDERGAILVTAHTAGWEVAGPRLSRDRGLRVMIVERAEQDTVAREIQDQARRAQGLLVAHVGDDPLSALPLVKHLRDGGIVALQIDRAPPVLRGRNVSMFGRPARVPEGPLRLAALTRAPIVPVFVARTGRGRYELVVRAPVRLSRSPAEAELDSAAQEIANALSEFLQAHPTQWFHFRDA